MAYSLGIWYFKHATQVGPLDQTRIVAKRTRAGWRFERQWKDASWETQCERKFFRTLAELEAGLRAAWAELQRDNWRLISGAGMAAAFDLDPIDGDQADEYQISQMARPRGDAGDPTELVVSLRQGGSAAASICAAIIYGRGSDIDAAHFGDSHEAAAGWIAKWMPTLRHRGWRAEA